MEALMQALIRMLDREAPPAEGDWNLDTEPAGGDCE